MFQIQSTRHALFWLGTDYAGANHWGKPQQAKEFSSREEAQEAIDEHNLENCRVVYTAPA